MVTQWVDKSSDGWIWSLVIWKVFIFLNLNMAWLFFFLTQNIWNRFYTAAQSAGTVEYADFTSAKE